MDDCRAPVGDDGTLEQVADLLQGVYAAAGVLADELHRIRIRILGSRARVTHATVDRVTRLADRLRPGAHARAELSGLDPAWVLGGTTVRVARHRERAADSATGRAASRWSGLASA